VNQFKTLLAKNIKRARNRAGLTQQELAELCGLSTNYLATLETGGKFPSSDTLEIIAKALRLKPYELFVDESDIEAFNRQELIARFVEKAKGYISEGLDKAAKEVKPKK